jgi:hypothetical protein
MVSDVVEIEFGQKGMVVSGSTCKMNELLHLFVRIEHCVYFKPPLLLPLIGLLPAHSIVALNRLMVVP